MMPMVEYVKEIESMGQIIKMLWDPEVRLFQGKSIAQVSRERADLLGQARLLKELEQK